MTRFTDLHTLHIHCRLQATLRFCRDVTLSASVRLSAADTLCTRRLGLFERDCTLSVPCWIPPACYPITASTAESSYTWSMTRCNHN